MCHTRFRTSLLTISVQFRDQPLINILLYLAFSFFCKQKHSLENLAYSGLVVCFAIDAGEEIFKQIARVSPHHQFSTFVQIYNKNIFLSDRGKNIQYCLISVYQNEASTSFCFNLNITFPLTTETSALMKTLTVLLYLYM